MSVSEDTAKSGDTKQEDMVKEAEKPTEKENGVSKEVVENKEVKADSEETKKEELEDSESEEPKSKKKKVPPAKKPSKKEKKAESDEDDEAEPEPRKESKKAAKPRGKAKKVEKDEDKDESDEEEEDDAETENKKDGKVPLLDQPLQLDGARARKTVSRFSVDAQEKDSAKEFTLPEGRGTKLGEIPRIELQIKNMKMQDIKPLGKIILGRAIKTTVLKKTLRQFNGYDFEPDSGAYEKKKQVLLKCKLAVLKPMCQLLDLEKKGTVPEVAERILEFLMEPKDSGKKLPQKKRRAARSGSYVSFL